MKSIRATVNGRPVAADIPDNLLLIDLLREHLRLTGTKESCGVGVCGACTVALDGKPVSACLTLAVFADGCAVETIEGVADGDELHPLQKAFIRHGGYQCGMCTPGQIMSAKALLNEHPRPSRSQIQEWMMGNLCRCTGYYKILESIESVAEESRPEAL
jgi:aerobic carbon-monoxide dehydrogenase small subunit